jgi:hypothetical protein
MGSRAVTSLAALALMSAVLLCPGRCLGASVGAMPRCHRRESAPAGAVRLHACCPIVARAASDGPALTRVDSVSAALPSPALATPPARRFLTVRRAAERASPPRPLYLHTLVLLI